MRRGEIWWADLGPRAGSKSGYRRPFLIVSSNSLNSSALATILTIPITSNLAREAYPGNVRLPERESGLSKPTVAIVSPVTALNRRAMIARAGRLPDNILRQVDQGLRLVLSI